MGVNRVTSRKTAFTLEKMAMAMMLAPAAKVGYPEETTGSVIHDEADVPLAQLAAWNELGTQFTPPRAFMRQGADMLVMRRGLLTPAVHAFASGRIDSRAFIATVGAHLKGNIQSAIRRQDFAPLAPATIAAKGSDTILIDTSEMVDGLDVHVGFGI